MAEKILEKLGILDEQAKAFLAIRAKKNNLQGQVRKKISVIPLTFDFQLEFEKAIATPIMKTESKITKDRSHGINKTKRYSSFKNKPEPKKANLRPHFVPTNIKIQEIKSIEPVEENLKSRPIRSFRYLKDTREMENAKPLHELHLQHKQQQCRRTLGSTIISSVSSIQPNAYKEEEDSVNRIKSSQMNDFSAKENESIISDQLNEYSARKRNSLPLCFEDELERPNAKIISICPAKTATSHMKQSDTNPVIFHETGYVQMLLLTKNRLPPHSMENVNGYPYTRSNVVLERNCEMLKSVVRGQSISLSEPKRTMSTAQRKDVQTLPFEVGHGVVEDKLRKRTSKQTSENTSWSKPCNFSRTFSSLTKKFVSFLDKTVIQEVSAKTATFEKVFSTVKPMSKFNALPVKYCSKPSKNVLKVYKVSNVTPLDDLLNLSSKN